MKILITNSLVVIFLISYISFTISLLDISFYLDIKSAFLQKPDKSCYSEYHSPPIIKDMPEFFQIFLI